MKILFLSDDFPPNSFGGTGIVAHDLAIGLHVKNHDVFIITTVRKKSEEEKIEIEGLKISSTAKEKIVKAGGTVK